MEFGIKLNRGVGDKRRGMGGCLQKGGSKFCTLCNKSLKKGLHLKILTNVSVPPPPLNDHNLLRWPETFCQTPLNLYETPKTIQNTEQSDASFFQSPYVKRRTFKLQRQRHLFKQIRQPHNESRNITESRISLKFNIFKTKFNINVEFPYFHELTPITHFAFFDS